MVVQPDIFLVHMSKEQQRQLEEPEQFPVGYFEHYFTSYNFLLLVPFRLRRSSKNTNVIIIQKNLFHQILCGVLLLSSLMGFIQYLSGSINADIYAEPNKLFDVAINGTRLLYVVVFFSLCWGKRDEILNFANLSSSNFLCKSKLFYAALSIYPHMLNALLLYQDWDWDYDVPFTTQDNWFWYLYSATSLVGLLTSTLLTTFVDTYVVILALSGYNQVKSSAASIENLVQWKMAENLWKLGDFSCLIDVAEKLERFFISLNMIGSHIILTWFCMLVPWVSYKILDSLPGTSSDLGSESVLVTLTGADKRVIGQIYYWVYIVLYLGILVLCAEIKRECNNIKCNMKRLILKYNPSVTTGRAALVKIEHFLENVGVHGGFFFTFSYSFLGSVISGIVNLIGLAFSIKEIWTLSQIDLYTDPEVIFKVLTQAGANHIKLVKSVIAEGHNVRKLQELFTKMALNLKNYYDILNRFGRGFFLAWFFMVVPWLAYHFVENLPGMKLLHFEKLIYNWVFIIFYGTILLFCAEARKQDGIWYIHTRLGLFLNYTQGKLSPGRCSDQKPKP
ncbi:unnamed protein product [Orchesella dallaii]|uniref:Gustatory receptor n=1 Tax=Orchesella dallaii TaxID=48710 RepID=A0ABP1RRJ2_9HEXA